MSADSTMRIASSSSHSASFPRKLRTCALHINMEDGGCARGPGVIEKQDSSTPGGGSPRTQDRRQGEQSHLQSHARKKRPPKRLTHAQRLNDVYVNRHSDFVSQLARCRKLLDQGVSVLYIHGLGAAINRAINLALQLKETHSEGLEVTATTSTVEVTDDLEPLTESGDHYTQTRNVSALHITLYRRQVVEPSSSVPSP